VASTSGASPLKAVVVDVKKETAKAISKGIPYNAAGYTTGKSAASLTSTSADVSTKSEPALIDEEEWMFERILAGEKGYVAIQTNFGKLNVELFCDRVCFKAPQMSLVSNTVSYTGAEDMLQFPHAGSGRQV